MRPFILLACLTFFITLLLNPGWIAMDEYNHGMLLYLPAQSVDIDHVKELSILRSPMQVMPMYFLGKLAYFVLGIESNWGQYRFIQCALGLFNLILLFFGTQLFYKYESQKDSCKGALALIACHFVSSFIFTRPMFESIATPIFFLSLAFFQNFCHTKKSRTLFLFFFFLGISCIFRPHCAIFALVPALWIIENKRWSLALTCFLFGLVSVLIVGLPDWFFYQKPFHMFQDYLSHNLEENKFFSNVSKYGVSSWWVYIPTFIGISFIPFFIKLKNFPYKENLLKYKHYWLGIIAFIGIHSAIPHKEERFLIPLLPITFICIAPAIVYIFKNRKLMPIRWRSLLTLNFMIWGFAVSTPAQNNAISFARYLKKDLDIKYIQYPAEAKLMVYSLFFERQDVQTVKVSFEKLKKLSPKDCHGHYLFRYDLYEKIKENTSYEFVRKFNPGLIEYLIVLGNPKHNARRGPLYLLKCNQ